MLFLPVFCLQLALRCGLILDSDITAGTPSDHSGNWETSYPHRPLVWKTWGGRKCCECAEIRAEWGSFSSAAEFLHCPPPCPCDQIQYLECMQSNGSSELTVRWANRPTCTAAACWHRRWPAGRGLWPLGWSRTEQICCRWSCLHSPPAAWL